MSILAQELCHEAYIGTRQRVTRDDGKSNRQTTTMQRFLSWLGNKLFQKDEPEETELRRSGARVMPKPVAPVRVRPKPAVEEPPAEFTSEVGGKIEDGGPGKNVLVRNKYVREDTGTHETLKIIDDSVLEPPEEDGIDPYNTGRFDRSKSWDSSRTK